MTNGREAALERDDSVQDDDLTDDRGWYLYGVTWSDRLTSDELSEESGGSESMAERGAPWRLEIVEEGRVAAIVRSVRLSEFEIDAEALQGQTDEAAQLEALLGGHNLVISVVHERQAIVPARFGSLYSSVDDVRQAMIDAEGDLVAQLESIEGCDEWAVHVYADRRAVTTGRADARVQQLEAEIASARPGRAYFLRRQLEEERAAAAGRALHDLAETAFEGLARHAVASQSSAPRRAVQPASGVTEVLRAAFLVERQSAEAFRMELLALEEEEGVRTELTGPWPPYSFVTLPVNQL